MSRNLFTKAPTLRAALRRAQPQFQSASYHSTNAPKMPSGPQHLQTLIRQTTLRASTTALQRTSYPVALHFHTRPRTPSPPPPYQTRGLTLRAPTDHWTHFSTPYTLSSIRTFTSTRAQKLASEAPASSSIPPETQARVDAAIEQIADMYGTAKDEFDIACEESEKNTTYAPDDRAAAREELDRLVEFYEGVLAGDRVVAEEVRRRVGGRIRELIAGVERMEEEALHGD